MIAKLGAWGFALRQKPACQEAITSEKKYGMQIKYPIMGNPDRCPDATRLEAPHANNTALSFPDQQARDQPACSSVASAVLNCRDGWLAGRSMKYP